MNLTYSEILDQFEKTQKEINKLRTIQDEIQEKLRLFHSKYHNGAILDKKIYKNNRKITVKK